MLMVIFGAGASYDSVARLRGVAEPCRPPLADELFEARPIFMPVMKIFGRCRAVVPYLQRSGVSVEQELAKIAEQAKQFSPASCELLAIQLYLSEALYVCERDWADRHIGVTNYATLVREIERWRLATGEQVCFVTFNYDTMLETAMQEVLRFQIVDMDTYISKRSPYRVIKLHGSVDWWRVVEGYVCPENSMDTFIDDAPILNISNHFRRFKTQRTLHLDGAVVAPAIAIPVHKKDQFACPQEHVEELARIIPHVTKIITIGWRSSEDLFVNMLRSRLTGLTLKIDLMIVSGDKKGADETFCNLGIEVSGNRYAHVTSGFSGAVLDDRGMLNALLYQSPWQA